MRHALAPIFFSLLLLWGCGKDNQSGENPNPPPVTPPTPGNGPVYTLKLWGAEWCENCHAAYTVLSPQLKDAQTAKKLKIDIFVPTNLGKKKPKQEDVDKYKAASNYPFEYKLDDWHFKQYRVDIGSEGFGLPAGALFDENGKKVKTYPAPLDPNQVAAEVQGILK